MNRVLIFILVALQMLLPEPARAQDLDSALTETLKLRNTIEVGFFGSGLVISASYQRKLVIRPSWYMNLAAGIGTVPASGGITLPHQLSFNLGRRKNYLELGIAGTCWTGLSNVSGYTERKYSYQFSPLVGYRRQVYNGMVLRAYLNPLIHVAGEYYLETYTFIPYGGLGFGHSF